MSVTRIHDEGQTLSYPKGKVLGVVHTRAELDALVRALQSAGFEEIEALNGDEGVHLLERIGTFFFSDTEDQILAKHIEELKAGHTIVAIKTPSDRVDEAVRVASQAGARHLVHFGPWTITWLTK